MKLYHPDEAEETLKRGGILLETVDCEVCGRVMVPHLLEGRSGELFGLCTEHLPEYPKLWAAK